MPAPKALIYKGITQLLPAMHKHGKRRELMFKQMKDAQGVTEQMKADDMMLWVGKVSNICACADEIIRSELIYN